MKCVMLLMTLVLAHPAMTLAQCPDGSPPPCSAPVPPRRPPLATPALDDATWLVLPFDNIGDAPATAWVRDASVNLLYLEMSRWQDLRVIDDERVADRVRRLNLPPGRAVSLDAGLAMARQLGAGRVVMGDILPAGTGIRLVAKVFATRTGERVHTTQETPHADSLLAAFERLARGILAVGAGAGPESARITTSLVAYRAYLDGLRALGAFDLARAEQQFTRAIAIDSAFALAHAKLAATFSFRHHVSFNEVRQHAATAHRLGTSLPERERRLILAIWSSAEGRFQDACSEARALIAADATDAEAWLMLGECTFHDRGVVLTPEGPRFRSSWEESIEAFRRVTELAPGNLIAHPHVPEMLSAANRRGCDVVTLPARCEERWSALLELGGDTIATYPIDLIDSTTLRPQPPPPDVIRRTETVLAARELEAATRWATLSAGQPLARLAKVHALLRTGALAQAGAEAATLAIADFADGVTDRQLTLLVDAAVRSGDIALADARLGEVERSLDGTEQTRALRTAMIWNRVILGQLSVVSRLVTTRSPGQGYVIATWRVAAGLPGDSLPLYTERHRAMLVQAPPPMRRSMDELLGASAELAAFGTPWAFSRESSPGNPGDFTFIIRALRAGDTTTARQLLAAHDSAHDASPRGDLVAVGFLLGGEAHLALGDSAQALSRLQRFMAHIDRSWSNIALVREEPIYGSHLFGRGLMLLGDLAMARGEPAVAREAYRRLVTRWARADAELQPVVARARAALVSLPP